MEKKKNIKPEESPKREPRFRITSAWVVKNIPYFLFLGFLAVVYIYNGHQADKMIRNISATEKHIQELEFEFKSVKSEVIYRSKASELAKAVEPLGLKESLTPPAVLDTTKKQ